MNAAATLPKLDIRLHEVSKRFRYEWVLRGVNLELSAGLSYAVTGPNGAGKSTLLKMLCGHLSPSRGNIHWLRDGHALDSDEVFRAFTLAAPYIELIEEFTLLELLRFQQRFRPLMPGLELSALLDLMELRHAAGKEVRHFSSGMKQRLKLALALCFHSSAVLLDEPSTNLDARGIRWYRSLVETYAPGRLLVVASNVEADFEFCRERISVLDFKGG